jgi:hypothetical protein
LGVTPSDDDLRPGILAAHAANRRARILIGGRRDGARIQDDQLGLRGCGGAAQTALLELTFNRGTIGLSRTATEVL